MARRQHSKVDPRLGHHKSLQRRVGTARGGAGGLPRIFGVAMWRCGAARHGGGSRVSPHDCTTFTEPSLAAAAPQGTAALRKCRGRSPGVRGDANGGLGWRQCSGRRLESPIPEEQ